MSTIRQTIGSRLFRVMSDARHARRVRSSRVLRRSALALEAFEARQLLTLPPTLSIPLIPEFDQFGDQVLVVQGFDIPERGALGIFDSGASAVTFSGNDQTFFDMSGYGIIPIKVPGGAKAEGIGGEIVGDVSEPGVIVSDGMASFNLTFDDDLFPVFDITLRDSALETPGIQAFVGTEASPLLPTITGTPALNPSPKYPNGAAAWVNMLGAELDFSGLMPEMESLVIPFPDLQFVEPGQVLLPDTTHGSVFDTIVFPMIPFGADNSANPGDLITESLLWLIPNVHAGDNSVTTGATNFLFDTGAQLSVISTDMALELGLDLDQPETTIDVQGVAGTMTVPGFTLDTLDMQRDDGGWVSYANVPVYVLDVAPGIDGIFGMNLMNVASQFLFDPKHPDGPQVAISYFSEPDRGGMIFDDELGELAALLNLVGLNILGGSLDGGFGLPGLGSMKYSPTTSVTTSAATVPYGQSWSVSAALDFPTGSQPPSGLIEFRSGGTLLATVPVDSQGKASWVFEGAAWDVGSYSVSATYSGDDRYYASAGSTLLQVSQAATSLTVSTDKTVVRHGEPVIVQGTLSFPSGSSPAGRTVKLLVDGVEAGATQTAANGSYGFSVSNLAVGSRVLKTEFAGGGNFAGSTSGTTSVSVTPSAPATLALAAPTAAVFGQTVTLTASVSADYAPAFEGAVVSFFGSGGLLGSATMNAGSAKLDYKIDVVPQSLNLTASVVPLTGGQAISAGASAPLRISKASVSITWFVVIGRGGLIDWQIRVSPIAPGSGMPTGLVRIMTGGPRPRMFVLPLVDGRATYRFRGIPNAPRLITYQGDAKFGSRIVGI
jgi:hypothetical protein